MDGPEPAIGEQRGEVQLRRHELKRNQNTDEEPNDPENREETANPFIALYSYQSFCGIEAPFMFMLLNRSEDMVRSL